jgi:hypothetical protein
VQVGSQTAGNHDGTIPEKAISVGLEKCGYLLRQGRKIGAERLLSRSWNGQGRQYNDGRLDFVDCFFELPIFLLVFFQSQTRLANKEEIGTPPVKRLKNTVIKMRVRFVTNMA